jgi:predicted lipid-binding transport protein (Tim44 family)
VPADLIVFALVAAGLIFWLRSILGTRHGDERDRPSPYMSEPEKIRNSSDKFQMDDSAISAEQRIIDLALHPTNILAVDNKSAEIGLIEISKAEKTFDINHFLQGAQDAFVYIVESFAEGDRETLQNLLSPAVYRAFEHAISEREARGETQKTEIHAIRKADIMDARLEDKTALVTVRFRAEETSVTRDSVGEIVAGHPDKITEMRDIWVFARPLRSKDPRWLVQETRSDFEGDNDLIPNSN